MGIALKDSDIKELTEIHIPMLGRLATEDDISNPIQENLDSVRFYITALCDEPEKLMDISMFLNMENEKALYVAFDNTIKQFLPMEYKHETFNRRKKLEEYLKNKLIVFKTDIKISEELGKNKGEGGYKQCLIYKNIQPEEIIKSSKLSEQTFTKVPILNISNKDFILKLKNNEYIEFNEYPTFLSEPEFILCDNNIYMFRLRNWQKHDTNKRMWSYSGNITDVKIIKPESIKLDENNSFKYSNYTYFISDDILEDVLDLISIEEFIKYKNDNSNDETKTGEENNNEDIKEINFIKGLKIYCESKGLYYSYKDIVNLHISIKTNLITIIAGMSGTGKSQLAWAYAKMIDSSRENENLIFIPISPSYVEPSDVLGYFNPTNGLYIPAETGLVDFLVRAQKNINKQYLIIFDEMNLSQVEHWFAPFISLLETDEENRVLNLYSKNNRCMNEEKYPDKIKIGNNIKIIGTINLDETVKEFSDRVLDRANIIHLEKKKFNELSEISIDSENDELYEKYICRDLQEYRKWEKPYNMLYILKDELSFFDEFHELISNYDSRKGISFRVVNSIANYIGNIPKDENGNGTITKEEAIDIQVKQRIISKLKGTKRTVGNLIGEYDFDKNTTFDSPLIDFLQSKEDISSFERTIKYINLKAKELSLYGYTY